MLIIDMDILVGGTTPKGTKEQWQINVYKQSNMLCESMW